MHTRDILLGLLCWQIFITYEISIRAINWDWILQDPITENRDLFELGITEEILNREALEHTNTLRYSSRARTFSTREEEEHTHQKRNLMQTLSPNRQGEYRYRTEGARRVRAWTITRIQSQRYNTE
jgi:hypothetical protein